MLKYKYILLIFLLFIIIFSLYGLIKNNYLKLNFETFKNIEFFNNCNEENIYILDKNIIMKIINQN